MHIKISKTINDLVIKQLAYNTREKVGLIGSSGNNIIDNFFYDTNALSEKNHCKLSITDASVFLEPKKVSFAGIVHSHPSGRHLLSDADIEYARNIIHASKRLPFVIMGIVSDNKLYLYLVNSSGVVPLDLLII